MRMKIQEFKVSTFVAAITRFQQCLRPDTISLVNNICDRSIKERSFNSFAPAAETPHRAAATISTSNDMPDSEKSTAQPRHYFCENCTQSDGSLGTI